MKNTTVKVYKLLQKCHILFTLNIFMVQYKYKNRKEGFN